MQKRPEDYIDSCVFLHHIFHEGYECKRYLNTVGYKHHNIGVISHFVLSEILFNILTKVKSDDPLKAQWIREDAFRLLEILFTKMVRKRTLHIIRLSEQCVDMDIFHSLKMCDHSLTDDDVFHLVAAINDGCRRFITIDRELTENERLKSYLLSSYGLRIEGINIQT